MNRKKSGSDLLKETNLTMADIMKNIPHLENE